MFTRLPPEIRVKVYHYLLDDIRWGPSEGRHAYPFIPEPSSGRRDRVALVLPSCRPPQNLPNHLLDRTSLDADTDNGDLRLWHHQNERYRVKGYQRGPLAPPGPMPVLDALWSTTWHMEPQLPYLWRDIHGDPAQKSPIYGLSLTSKLIQHEVLAEFHRRTEFWCTEAEELVELIHRTNNSGTRFLVTSLHLDFWLWNILPASDLLRDGFNISFKREDEPWTELMETLQSGTLRTLFPNLKRLFLAFSPFYASKFRDGRYCFPNNPTKKALLVTTSSSFIPWLAETLAGQFYALPDLDVKISGIRSEELVRWVKEGIAGRWDGWLWYDPSRDEEGCEERMPWM